MFFGGAIVERWKRGTNCIYNIGYHLIWCSKYRRPVLTGEAELRLRELILQRADFLGVEIVSVEIMPEHVHVFVKCPPTFSPHQIVKQIKGYSSRVLRDEYPTIRSRIPTLWTNSYYCESVGHISEDTVKKYIEDQKRK